MGGVVAVVAASVLTAIYVKKYKYKDMATVLDRAERMAGLRKFPTPRTDFVTLTKVDGKSWKAKRKQRKLRRKDKRHNREVRRANRKMRVSMRKELRIFNKFFAQTKKRIPLLTKEQLVKALVKLNKNNALCDGTIGKFYGKIGVRMSYRRPLTPDKKCNKKCRKKFDRKVNRHNRKVDRQRRIYGISSRRWVLKYLSGVELFNVKY